MACPPSRSSPHAHPLVYKLYIPRCSSPVHILNKILPFPPLRSPLKPHGPTHARDARPRPKAKSFLLISYRSRDHHHSSAHQCDLLRHDPNHLRASFATPHVLARQPRVSVRVRFRLGEPVLTVYTNSVLYEFTHHVSRNMFAHSHSIAIPNPR